MDDEEEKVSVYRLTVLGAMRVGKTCFINQFVNSSFQRFDFDENAYEATVDDCRQYRRVIDLNAQSPDAAEYCVILLDDR
jgi:GTPase SAR1 family protein